MSQFSNLSLSPFGVQFEDYNKVIFRQYCTKEISLIISTITSVLNSKAKELDYVFDEKNYTWVGIYITGALYSEIYIVINICGHQQYNIKGHMYSPHIGNSSLFDEIKSYLTDIPDKIIEYNQDIKLYEEFINDMKKIDSNILITEKAEKTAYYLCSILHSYPKSYLHEYNDNYTIIYNICKLITCENQFNLKNLYCIIALAYLSEDKSFQKTMIEYTKIRQENVLEATDEILYDNIISLIDKCIIVDDTLISAAKKRAIEKIKINLSNYKNEENP
jgi:hypothetical protein